MEFSSLNIHQILNAAQANFNQTCLDLFRYQASHNPIYYNYLSALDVAHDQVKKITDIPFLPISFFKTHDVRTGQWRPATEFTSSGTTGLQTSRHPVRDLNHYLDHCKNSFESVYGSLEDYCILGLLPSYLERTGSGLIAMVEGFMNISNHPLNGYFLYNHQDLAERLANLENQEQKTLLIGVTFGLIDFAAQYPIPLKSTIVMETGGMKGRSQELTRDAVHEQLQKAFCLSHIHSEYGMTELSSQAYSHGNGIYRPSPGMQVLVRETTDPLSCHLSGSGGLNIIDLANLHTCAFIATEDLGKVHPDGRFEVLGRFDQSDARGCNLMVP
jgi:Acyl-protein synthetase, LuxE